MNSLPTCDRCGREILPGKSLAGVPVSADEVAQNRYDLFGAVLCDACASDRFAQMAQEGATPQQLIGMMLRAGQKSAERRGEYIPAGVKSLIGALEADGVTPQAPTPRPTAPSLQALLRQRMADAAALQEQAILGVGLPPTGGFTPRTGPSKVAAVDWGEKPSMTAVKAPIAVESVVATKQPLNIKFQKFTPTEYASKLYGEALSRAMYVGAIVVTEIPEGATKNEIGLEIAECAEIFGYDVAEVRASSPNQIAFRIIEAVDLVEDEDDEDDDY